MFEPTPSKLVISGRPTVCNSIPIVLVAESPRTVIPFVLLPDNVNSAVLPPSSSTVVLPVFSPENLTLSTAGLLITS